MLQYLWNGPYTSVFPLPETSNSESGRVAELVVGVTEAAEECREFERGIADEFQSQFDVPTSDGQLVEWLSLTDDKFCRHIDGLADAKGFAAKAKPQLEGFRRETRSRQIKLLQKQLAWERELSDCVEQLYGLSEVERRLLSETLPPRDPLRVLEARVAGVAHSKYDD